MSNHDHTGNGSNGFEQDDSLVNQQKGAEKVSKGIPPVVLKFKKRLYDGGNEMELINKMERYSTDAKLAQESGMQLDEMLNTIAGSSDENISVDNTSEESRQQKLNDLKPLMDTVTSIENKYVSKRNHLSLVKSTSRQEPVAGNPLLEVLSGESAKTVTDPSAAKSKIKKVLEALLLGPLEVSVAVVGSLTALFALLTFSYFKNEELNRHSREVLQECKKTFFRGLKDCVNGPGKAFRAMISK